MSIYDREDPKPKGKKRGSVANASRLAGLTPNAGKGGTADWGTAKPDWLAGVISAATLAGCNITFSLSRDGGAHGLQLYSDGERVQIWFNGDADLDLELEKVYAYLETLR